MLSNFPGLVAGTFFFGGMFLLVWMNIHLARKKVQTWSSNSTIYFLLTMTTHRKPWEELWIGQEKYSELDARIISRYQWQFLFEMPILLIVAGFIGAFLGQQPAAA
jgi:hypothetical protein